MIERSMAIKCPNISYHLAGTKKMQQVVASPGVLERYFTHLILPSSHNADTFSPYPPPTPSPTHLLTIFCFILFFLFFPLSFIYFCSIITDKESVERMRASFTGLYSLSGPESKEIIEKAKEV